MNPFGFETFALLLIVLAVAALWSTVKMVPQGYNYTVENFGRYTRTLSPGLHILVPVMERVGAKMNMKEQVIDIPSQDIITRDNAMVTVDGTPVEDGFSIAGDGSLEIDGLRYRGSATTASLPSSGRGSPRTEACSKTCAWALGC